MNEQTKKRWQDDALALGLFALGTLLAVCFVNWYRQGPPLEPTLLSRGPLVLIDTFGQSALLLFALALLAFGARAFAGARRLALTRHALASVGCLIGLSFAIGAVVEEAGGAVGALAPGALGGWAGTLTGLGLGLAVLSCTIWVAWLAPREVVRHLVPQASARPTVVSAAAHMVSVDEARGLLPLEQDEEQELVVRPLPRSASSAVPQPASSSAAARDVRAAGGVPPGTRPLESRQPPALAASAPAGASSTQAALLAQESRASSAAEPAQQGSSEQREAAVPRWEHTVLFKASAAETSIAQAEPIEQPASAVVPASSSADVNAPDQAQHSEGLQALRGAPRSAPADDASQLLPATQADPETQAAVAPAPRAPAWEGEPDSPQEPELPLQSAAAQVSVAAMVDEPEPPSPLAVEEHTAEPANKTTRIPASLFDDIDDPEEPAGGFAGAQREAEPAEALLQAQSSAAEDLEQDEPEQPEGQGETQAAAGDRAAARFGDEQEEEHELGESDAQLEAPAAGRGSGSHGAVQDPTAADLPADSAEFFAHDPVPVLLPQVVLEPAARETLAKAAQEQAPVAEPEPVYMLDPQPASEIVVELDLEAEADPRERLVRDCGLLFLERQRVAVSMLQREFSLDFKQATEILDELQQRGLIGPYLGGTRRDILMTRADWIARLAGSKK